MSNINDFVIEDGILARYNGSDAEVVIPDGVTEIKNYAFSSKTFLKSVIIPNSVTHIGFSAFQCCTALENVKLGNALKVIADSAFSECYALKRITIPCTMTAIGALAFNDCSALENAIFDNCDGWTVYSEQYDDDMEMFFSELKNHITSEDLADPSNAAACLSKKCSAYYWCCNDMSYLEYMKSFQ